MDLFRIVNRYFIKKYIKRRSDELSICSKTNIDETLDYYETLPALNKQKLVFLFLKSSATKQVDISTAFNKSIIANAEWAAQLVLFNSDTKTTNRFLISVGHEIGHNQDFKNNYKKQDKKFVNWVTEVHHDFYASKIMANYSRLKLIEAIQYKITLKPNNIDGKTHPSWKKRLKYVSSYDFDESLIQKIADDVGCQNEELIKEISAYYEPIMLV